jgi:ATP-dependent RNA helicase MRH4
LPPRRQRKTHNLGDVEYDTSGLAQDQDELSYARSTRRRPNSRAASTRSASRGGRSTTGGALRETTAPATNTRGASRRGRASKTYSRTSSNKENESDGDEENEVEESMFEPLPDDTFDAGTGEPFTGSEELRRAKKFFEEVDRFEMSFEVDDEPEELIDAR